MTAVSALLPTPRSADGNGDGKRAAGRQGSGSLADSLLPTPGATDWKGSSGSQSRDRDGHRRTPGDADLPEAIALLKTPTAQLAVNGGSQHPDKRRAGGHGPTLADQLEHLLPTPQASGGRAGAEAETGNARPSGAKRSLKMATAVTQLLPTPRATDGTKGGPNQRGSSGDLMLPSAVMLLPTPTSRDGKGRDMPGREGGAGLPEALLPTPTAMDSHGARNATAGRNSLKASTNNDGWTLSDVFWTGESTRPRSGGGKPSSGDARPRQLSLDEAEYPA